MLLSMLVELYNQQQQQQLQASLAANCQAAEPGSPPLPADQQQPAHLAQQPATNQAQQPDDQAMAAVIAAKQLLQLQQIGRQQKNKDLQQDQQHQQQLLSQQLQQQLIRSHQQQPLHQLNDKQQLAADLAGSAAIGFGPQLNQRAHNNLHNNNNNNNHRHLHNQQQQQPFDLSLKSTSSSSCSSSSFNSSILNISTSAPSSPNQSQRQQQLLIQPFNLSPLSSATPTTTAATTPCHMPVSPTLMAHDSADLLHHQQQLSSFDLSLKHQQDDGCQVFKPQPFKIIRDKDNNFSCQYCSKKYQSMGALKMHVRTHTLPCQCKICGKSFSRPWLLQGHIRTHTGEKPFKCDQCHRAFADRSNLRAHLQTHAKVKKYSCKCCLKTFSRMSLQVKHEEHCNSNNGINAANSNTTLTNSTGLSMSSLKQTNFDDNSTMMPNKQLDDEELEDDDEMLDDGDNLIMDTTSNSPSIASTSPRLPSPL